MSSPIYGFYRCDTVHGPYSNILIVAGKSNPNH